MPNVTSSGIDHSLLPSVSDARPTPFQFESHEIRTVADDQGDPWFVAKDVAAVFGYRMASDATRILPADEKGTLGLPEDGTHQMRTQQLSIVSEAGLYRLVLRSNSPKAKRFQHWVTHDVLPSIRKTGSYAQPECFEESVVRVLGEAQRRIEAQRLQLEAAKPKVEFFDRCADTQGRYGLMNAGRALGLKPRKFVEWLQRERYVFREGGALVPYAQYRERGLFEVKVVTVDDKSHHQTFVTPAGLQYFAERTDSPPELLQ